MASPSRRDLLKLAAATSASLLLDSPLARAAAPALTPLALQPLPTGAIRPAGWLRRQLQVQADGLGGHLHELWPDVGPNSGWLGGSGESWERGPYFLDGLVPLAWQLDDPRLKETALQFLNWTLDHQQASGALGPAALRAPAQGQPDWWPMMVMVKALAQFQEATADPRVLPALTHYFHYQLATMPSRPLFEWARYRWQDEAWVVQWLYDRTADPKLLELNALLQQQGYNWPAGFTHFAFTEPTTRAVIAQTYSGNNEQGMQTHGVNNSQGLKTAAVQYRRSGLPADHAAFDRQLTELYRYHGVPNGMFTCDEHLGGLEPFHGTELCSVVETMFSLEVALAVFGDPSIGDRIERIAYNALPGTFTDDMWAHQYDQQSNQVQVGLLSRPWTTNGPESNLYGLEPHFGCCTANFHQGWPKLTTHLWMRTPATSGRHDDGLAATLYAPCELSTTVRDNAVHLTVATDYPFRESVTVTVRPERALLMPLSFRIPGWCPNAQVRINGRLAPGTPTAASFFRVDRTWQPGDTVELTFPMQPRLSRWVHNAVAVERGPLLFSLSPGETWVKLRDHRPGDTVQPILATGSPFPVADWQVFPTRDWNVALAVQESAAAALPVTEAPVPSRPFSHGAAPAVAIQVPAHRLNSWRSEDGVAQPTPQSPVPVSGPSEPVTLIPYAAAKLRISVFPQAAPA